MGALAVARRLVREPPVVPGWLRPPPLRAGIVPRSLLVERLDALTHAPLTVVGAPTGYGKTTLLALWAASTGRRVAWVSVGAHELDADGFWSLLTAALERAEPGLRVDGGASDRPVRLATALRPLSGELVLVLDGFEQAMRAGSDAALRRLLDLAPPELRVVVSTRAEPELGLPLRRARGTVAELAADDLKLDAAEAAAILESSDDVARDIVERTEGWPAAVYLAALAARSAPDRAVALSGFSGADHDLASYLRLELLDAQPTDALRTFLLESSVLDRLDARLCDAALGRHDSEESLRALARGGAFLVPLEDAPHTYRYLRPVGEFLRAELARAAPERTAEVHRRAAVAYERAGLFEEAAGQLRAAGGTDDAGRLLSRHALDLVSDGHVEHVERLLATRAGEAAVHRRPALRAELHRLAAAGSDLPALSKAAERVAAVSAGLPGGRLRGLVLSTAQATQAYAQLLTGAVAEAYETGAAAYATADPDAGAPAAEAAAIASLAASRLGLAAAAAPLARASVSALARRGVHTGTAAALVELAKAAVAEAQGNVGEADRHCEDALQHTTEPPVRALALLQLARLRASSPAAARAALAEAQVELSRSNGAELLGTLAAETESELGLSQRARPATGELSPAEQRVLRLLATKLTQREIATELYVSLDTVKTHTRAIYRKLGVASRADAVAAARSLNLV